jgi:adenylate cyclase
LEAKPPQPLGAPEEAPRVRNADLSIDPQHVWDLWSVSLRLEMLCSTLENPGSVELKAPETALLERMKNRSDDGLTDRFLLNFVEHQISRIEVCALASHRPAVN